MMSTNDNRIDALWSPDEVGNMGISTTDEEGEDTEETSSEDEDMGITTTDEEGEDTEETSSGDENMGVTTTVAEGENAPCNFKNDGMWMIPPRMEKVMN